MSKIPPPIPPGSPPRNPDEPGSRSPRPIPVEKVPPPVPEAGTKPNAPQRKGAKPPSIPKQGDLSNTQLQNLLPPEEEIDSPSTDSEWKKSMPKAPAPPLLPGSISPTQTGIFVPPPVRGEPFSFEDESMPGSAPKTGLSPKIRTLIYALIVSLLVGGVIVGVLSTVCSPDWSQRSRPEQAE